MTQKDRDALDDWLKTAKGPFVLNGHVPGVGRSHTSHPVTREDILNAAREIRAQYPRVEIAFTVRSSNPTPSSFGWAEEAAPEPKTLDQWIKALKGTFTAYVYRGKDWISSTHYTIKYADAASFLDHMMKGDKVFQPTKFLLVDSGNTNNEFEYVVEGKKDAVWDGTVASLDKAIIERALGPVKSKQTLENWIKSAKYPVYIAGTCVCDEDRNVGPQKVNRESDFLSSVTYLRSFRPTRSIVFEARDDSGYGPAFTWGEGPLKPKTLKDWLEQVKTENVTISSTDRDGNPLFCRTIASHAPVSYLKGFLQRLLLSDYARACPFHMVATTKGMPAFEFDITDLNPGHSCWDALEPRETQNPPTQKEATTPMSESNPKFAPHESVDDQLARLKPSPKTLEEWMAQIKKPKVTVKGLDKNGTEVFRHDYDSHLSGVKVRESLQFDLREWLSPLRLPVRMIATAEDTFVWDVTDLSRGHPCWDLVAPVPPQPKPPVTTLTAPLAEALTKFVRQGPGPYEDDDEQDDDDAQDQDQDQDDTSIKPGDLVVHALSGTHGRVVQFVPDHEIRARTLDTAHEARVSVPAWAVDTKDGLKIYPEGSLEVVDGTWGQTAWALTGFVGGTLAATVFWILVTGALWR